MEIDLRVVCSDQFGNYTGAQMEVPEPFQVCFEPLSVTDDDTLAYVTGDLLANSREVEKVVRLRQDAAETMAKAITELLVEDMSRRDTFNGYKVKI